MLLSECALTLDLSLQGGKVAEVQSSSSKSPHIALLLLYTGLEPELGDSLICRAPGLFMLVPISGPDDPDVRGGECQRFAFSLCMGKEVMKGVKLEISRGWLGMMQSSNPTMSEVCREAQKIQMCVLVCALSHSLGMTRPR